MRGRKFTLLHAVALLSLLLFAAALCADAYSVRKEGGLQPVAGYQVFVMGAFAPLGGALFEWLVWLANPLFFLSVPIAFRGGRLALPFAWMAVLLAGNFLFWKEIAANERGGTQYFQQEAGYYCWLAAIVLWAVAWSGKVIFTGRKA